MSNVVVVGLNNFADITNEEYRNTYLGTFTDETPQENVATDLLAPLADTVDWRTKGAVTRMFYIHLHAFVRLVFIQHSSHQGPRPMRILLVFLHHWFR